ncbi:unnamed protein product [Amoebophrya sp. A25]|nr:unnamed protein product [Amoebophrya sp. A25]|eukprot:GSA25T00022310001.1
MFKEGEHYMSSPGDGDGKQDGQDVGSEDFPQNLHSAATFYQSLRLIDVEAPDSNVPSESEEESEGINEEDLALLGERSKMPSPSGSFMGEDPREEVEKKPKRITWTDVLGQPKIDPDTVTLFGLMGDGSAEGDTGEEEEDFDHEETTLTSKQVPPAQEARLEQSQAGVEGTPEAEDGGQIPVPGAVPKEQAKPPSRGSRRTRRGAGSKRSKVRPLEVYDIQEDLNREKQDQFRNEYRASDCPYFLESGTRIFRETMEGPITESMLGKANAERNLGVKQEKKKEAPRDLFKEAYREAYALSGLDRYRERLDMLGKKCTSEAWQIREKNSNFLKKHLAHVQSEGRQASGAAHGFIMKKYGDAIEHRLMRGQEKAKNLNLWSTVELKSNLHHMFSSGAPFANLSAEIIFWIQILGGAPKRIIISQWC